MLEIILIIVIAIIVVVFGVLFYLQGKKKNPEDDKSLELMKEWIQSTKEEMEKTRQEVRQGLDKSTDTMQKQFGQSIGIVNNMKEDLSRVRERLVKLDNTNKRVEDFAGQLQSLQDILKNPKQRGVLGEYFL